MYFYTSLTLLNFSLHVWELLRVKKIFLKFFFFFKFFLLADMLRAKDKKVIKGLA